MSTPTTITLTINVAPGVDPEDVKTDLNIRALCRMEEDDNTITGWSFTETTGVC